MLWELKVEESLGGFAGQEVYPVSEVSSRFTERDSPTKLDGEQEKTLLPLVSMSTYMGVHTVCTLMSDTNIHTEMTELPFSVQL